jgi:hypothetical protein
VLSDIKRKRRKRWVEEVPEEIMVEKFLNFEVDINLQI